jgi:hypothetical protein
MLLPTFFEDRAYWSEEQVSALRERLCQARLAGSNEPAITDEEAAALLNSGASLLPQERSALCSQISESSTQRAPRCSPI